MNIIEAIQTGQPIRRINHRKHAGSDGKGWLGSAYVLSLITPITTVSMYFEYTITKVLTQEDVLADDWEAKSPIQYEDVK